MNLLAGLLAAVGITLQVWIGALTIGAVLGLLVTLLRLSKNRFACTVAVVWIELTRGVPTIVWLFCVFFGLSSVGFRQSAILAAILAMGVMSSGYIAEIYRAGYESVNRGQFEGSVSLGVSTVTTIRSIILPQSLPVVTTSGATFGVHLLKETALASLIGVPELINIATYHVERGGTSGLLAFSLTGLIYIILSLPIVVIANKLRSRLDSKLVAR